MAEETRDSWLASVLHDLVKYLEMMPRSLCWDSLDDEDAEVLYEAVFETRSSRAATESARAIWARHLGTMPKGAISEARCAEVGAALDELERLVAPFETGGLGDADTERIRRLIWFVGDELRAANSGAKSN